MDSLVEVRNKYLDNTLVPYGKRFLCLGGFFVTKVGDICIRGVNKVLNTITIILD